MGDCLANLVDFVEVPSVGCDACQGLENGELFKDGSLGEFWDKLEDAHAQKSH